MIAAFLTLCIFTLTSPSLVWSEVPRHVENYGIVFAGSLVLDQSQPVLGFGHQHWTARGLLDLRLTVDLSSVLSLEGGQLHVGYQAHVGRDASDAAGALQAFSTIDSNDRSQLGEFWYEQWLFARSLRFKIGRVDANSEFAFVENSAEFLNSALSTSPTIFLLPTYPDPAASVNLFVYPHAYWYVGLGLYDGAARRGIHTGVHGPQTLNFADLFLIGEVGAQWMRTARALPGRLALGGWGHTGKFDRLTGGTRIGTAGVYLIFEQMLWREPQQREDNGQGLAMFFQAGYTDRTVSDIRAHFSAGFTWSGLIPHRDEDILGFGTTWVRLSPGTGLEKNDELALELFYKWQLTPRIALQTDAQYFSNPAGGSKSRDMLVMTVRFELAFSPEGSG